MAKNPFLAQQILKYTIGIQEYLSTPNIDQIHTDNDFKQQLTLTRARLQPGAANYQFDASPYSFFTTTYTPLTHTNNIDSRSRDALRPIVISTAIESTEDPAFKIVSALPPRRHQLFSQLKESLGAGRLTAAERKAKYFEQYGGLDNEHNNAYFIDNTDNDIVINVDEEFEENYIDGGGGGDDGDDANNNDNINGMNDDDGQEFMSMTDQKTKRRPKPNTRLVKGKGSLGLSIQDQMFDDVLGGLFGKNNNHNPQPPQLSADQLFQLERSRNNVMTGAAMGSDGLLKDEFDLFGNNNMGGDFTDFFETLGGQTGLDPILDTTDGGSKRKAVGQDIDTTNDFDGGAGARRHIPKPPGAIGLMDGLNSSLDLFDIDLERTIDGGSGFNVGALLSGATIIKSHKELDQQRQKVKDAKYEKELKDLYKEQGILSPQEEAEARRRRILGLDKK